MNVSVIASGSNGNCCLVEQKGVSVLIDAGKSCRETERRMNLLGKSLENVDGLVITHSHHDHIAGARVIENKYNVPVYVTEDILTEGEAKLYGISPKIFSPKRSFKVDGLEIKPVPTSHNVSSCGFVIGEFGLFTDTGIITRQMQDVFPKLKGVLLESNHDIDMVINGFYPYFLKQWILSDKGHLSNIDASSLIQAKGANLKLALLGHLSGNNNTPEKAELTFEKLVKRKIEYNVCSRDGLSGSWEI